MRHQLHTPVGAGAGVAIVLAATGLACARHTGTSAAGTALRHAEAAVVWFHAYPAPKAVGLASIARGVARRRGPRAVMPPAAQTYTAQWSWAARRAVFVAGEGYNTYLVSLSPRTGASRPVPGGLFSFYVRWSPDGRALLAIRNFRNTPTDFRRLTFIDLAHRHVAELLDSVATADFTPDGRAIVFSRLFVGDRPAGNMDFLQSFAPPGLRRAYYVSSPPGARSREIGNDEVDRLLGPAFRRAVDFWPKRPQGGFYRVGTINMGISPRRHYVFVPELQPWGLVHIDPFGVPVANNPTPEYGVMDGRGRLVRFSVPGSAFRLVGWSPDEKYLYGVGGFDESELITVTVATGKVRREKLKPPGNWHMYVIAFRPAQR